MMKDEGENDLKLQMTNIEDKLYNCICDKYKEIFVGLCNK